jgi:superfamily II DNA/RNA helicase
MCIAIHCRFALCISKLDEYVYAGTIRLCFVRTPKCKVVVFVATCHGVDFLHAAVTDVFPRAFREPFTEHAICKLHGDMDAADRNSVLQLLMHAMLQLVA